MADMPNIERWQDYDCPDSQIDFDLFDRDMVRPGQIWQCSGCGGSHVATDVWPEEFAREGDLLVKVPTGTFAIFQT